MSTTAHSDGNVRHSQLPLLLRQAVAAHEDGRLDAAYPLYRRFVDENPRHPTALQLLGLLHSQRGELETAIELMRQSLREFPQQAEVANNLGNALSRSGRLDEAIESYSQAVTLQPRYTDAWRNLGLSQLENKRFDEADRSFRRCLGIDPRDAAAWLCIGNLHKQQNRFEEAIQSYERALALRPDYAEAHHNLGVCLRIRQRPREALAHYQSAQSLGLERAELHQNRGSALVELGDVGSAIDAYRAAIERDPGDLVSHRSLNSLLWQQEQDDDYLESYRKALDEHPAAVPLQLAYAMSLNQMGAFGEAEQALLRALGHSRQSSELVSLLAYTLEGQGRWDEALKLHGAAVNMPGSDPNQRISFARALLARRRPDEALHQAKLGAMHMPNNQRALAYLGLCWRMLGDEREAILNDYDNLVRVFDIPVPASFANAAEFNERLNEVLDGLHIGKRHPPEQTLRGGTQTGGNLLDRQEREIRALVDSLRQCVDDYVRHLPHHPEHPMLARRSDSFGFSASWSVRLRPSGYHTMHTHPLGWISSAYYVQVPPEIEGTDAAGGGLKFGEPDIDIGEHGTARRHIQPAVGRLVLFPSYMWHGTVPFESDQPRTTVAFDVVPVSRR
jgi:uncharacterized protein (TIGR02466 family)